MANTTENPNEETIKCVVVGDNNVGKTRLICARAYDKETSYSRCVSCTGHVPTVWAIDQYRINDEVLRNARCNVDGTTVSLRLWDTFGDHHKNRKFAYGKGDVVLICFSICDEKSLKNVTRFWEPEVRKHCKNIPIILVGCKIDLRFADLGKVNKKKSYLTRAIRQSDILYPEQCQAVAEELNCPYYECSVLHHFGIDDIFKNVCRAALIYRRSLYFWNTGLKKIARPALQKPLKPPLPDPPVTSNTVPKPHLPNLIELYQQELLTDVKLICKNVEILAHKVILSSSSDVFAQFFLEQESLKETREFEFEVTSSHDFCQSCRDTREFQTFEVNKKSFVLTIRHSRTPVPVERPDNIACQATCPTNHCKCQQTFSCGISCSDNSVCSLNLAPHLTRIMVEFCYVGTLNFLTAHFHENFFDLATDIIMMAHCFKIPHLADMASLLVDNSSEEYLNDVTKRFLHHRLQKFDNFCVKQHRFSDVVFVVDDGCVRGHKVLLAAGSDMMYAMFAGRFIESGNKEVLLPEATTTSLRTVFEYVYLNNLQLPDDCFDISGVIALADRFCLLDLIAHFGNLVIDSFQTRDEEHKKIGDVNLIRNLCEDVVVILLTSQLHNAPDLMKWCLYFLCTHYNEACKYTPKPIKSLPADVRVYLEEHRWPPIWFIKQQDSYEKSVRYRLQNETRKSKKYY